MVASLPLFHRVAGQPVMVLGEGDAADAKRRLVERAGGIVVGEDNSEARLAFVCLDAPEDTVARLRCRGLLVNAVDRPDLCDFTVPSILDRDPVLVAIGTGGASAGLAKALRLRFEQILPASLGTLATRLAEARSALRDRWPDAVDRRRALDAALSVGGALDPLKAGSAEALTALLSGKPARHADAVETIQLRSHDPDELTLREARLLGSADTIVHDANVPAEVLDRARADARRALLRSGGEAPLHSGLTVVLRS